MISLLLQCVTIKTNLPKGNLKASCGPYQARKFTINYLDWWYTITQSSHAFGMQRVAQRISLKNPSSVHFSAANNFYTYVAHTLFNSGASVNWMFIIAKQCEHKKTKNTDVLFSFSFLITAYNKITHLFLVPLTQPNLLKQTNIIGHCYNWDCAENLRVSEDFFHLCIRTFSFYYHLLIVNKLTGQQVFDLVIFLNKIMWPIKSWPSNKTPVKQALSYLYWKMHIHIDSK